jgi:hypothetical protein
MVPQCAEAFGARRFLLYHAACFLSPGDRARDASGDRVDSLYGRARANRAAFLIEQPMKSR